MKNKKKYSLAEFSRALLLSIGMIGSSVVVAGADDSMKLPGLEPATFLGGLRIAERTPVGHAEVPVYQAYDAQAISRYLHQEADHPGIDPMQTASIIPGVFRSFAIPMKNFPVSARWAPIYRAISACAGNACQSKNRTYAKIVKSARKMGFIAKLEQVNRGVNQLITYRRDQAVYGSLDHWAKPSEILGRGAGDCEDFAILKMAALMDAGVPPQSMSLVVLQDSQKGVFHAVLSVATGSGIFILDNVRDSVLKDTSLPGYVPLYSFSTDRAWIHGAKTGGQQVAEVTGGLASIAPGEGRQAAASPRPRRAGWMPVVGG